MRLVQGTRDTTDTLDASEEVAVTGEPPFIEPNATQYVYRHIIWCSNDHAISICFKQAKTQFLNYSDDRSCYLILEKYDKNIRPETE